MKLKYIIMTMAAISCGASFAAEEATTTEKKADQVKWGGDFRLRTVYMNNVPTSVGANYQESSFQRYRTRLWAELHPTDNLYFRGRVVNEFRTQQTGDRADNWSAFDETVVDNLFMHYSHDLFDLRIGRQDMIYGTGKLILDGTPMDGSRTIYFDAAKLTYTGIEDTTIDLFAMYTQAENELALHTQNRNLIWNTDPTYDGAEAGGGLYIKNNSNKKMPWEAYWLLKTKEDSTTDFENVNTIGGRLMPKLNDHLDGNLEYAYQSDGEDTAFMVDALANWNITEKAKIGLGWYHLSLEWNPLFSRWPQYSELYVYSYTPADGGVGRWSNVSMPHIDISLSPMKKLQSNLLLGYMYAPEENGPGGGNERGLLFTWWNKFTIREKMLSDKDKLFGHFLAEMLQPGDYYTEDQQDKTAWFLRAELSYQF
ncbi:porin [Pontiellaceae bacterium B12227]|nr:porin [Pontiellaceae bacterium B12227]